MSVSLSTESHHASITVSHSPGRSASKSNTWCWHGTAFFEKLDAKHYHSLTLGWSQSLHIRPSLHQVSKSKKQERHRECCTTYTRYRWVCQGGDRQSWWREGQRQEVWSETRGEAHHLERRALSPAIMVSTQSAVEVLWSCVCEDTCERHVLCATVYVSPLERAVSYLFSHPAHTSTERRSKRRVWRDQSVFSLRWKMKRTRRKF